MSTLPKIVVILGPTASGKSTWAQEAAKCFDGEIVAADSRQVYKDMDIGTNKDKGVWTEVGDRKCFAINEICYHAVDFIPLDINFTLYDYKRVAESAIHDILKRKKLPIIVGGTGLYISALIENWNIEAGTHDKTLRDKLLQLSKIELWNELKEVDKKTAKVIDKHNKRRLIRALEIYHLTGKPVSAKKPKGRKLFNAIKIGVHTSRDLLNKKINRRVDLMFKDGLLDEVTALKAKYSNELSIFTGIGYRQLFDYLDEKLSLSEAKELIKRDTRRYARRQLTWWRKDKEIQWCNDYATIKRLIKGFI